VALSLRPALAGSQKVPGVPRRRARLPAARDVLAGYGLGAGDGLAAVAEPEAAVMSGARPPEGWSREEWAALQAELDDLERTDPAVAAAGRSYDAAVSRILADSTVHCQVCGQADAAGRERRGD